MTESVATSPAEPGPLQRALGIQHIEVDGRPPSADDLLWRATVNDGHFTAMQVRGGRVRGLQVHLERLREGSRELWEADLDPALVRERVRHALGTRYVDASVRVYVHCPEGVLSVMVTVRPPQRMDRSAKRVLPVPYLRPFPEVKHLGGFGQVQHARLAAREGFGEALLTGPDGTVSEGATTNVLFHDGARIVLPSAPALAGTTLRLLEAGLPAAGSDVVREPVRLAELGRFRAVFLANSQGIAPVRTVGEREFAVDEELLALLEGVYEATPWDAF